MQLILLSQLINMMKFMHIFAEFLIENRLVAIEILQDLIRECLMDVKS